MPTTEGRVQAPLLFILGALPPLERTFAKVRDAIATAVDHF